MKYSELEKPPQNLVAIGLKIPAIKFGSSTATKNYFRTRHHKNDEVKIRNVKQYFERYRD